MNLKIFPLSSQQFFQKFRKILRGYPYLHFLFRKFYRLLLYQADPPLMQIISKVLASKPKVFFIQVGSHDGITGDPIHNLIVENTNWWGIFIEPVPHAFLRLCETYHNVKNSSQRLIFENLAISKTAGEENFYCLSSNLPQKVLSLLPQTYDQLSSFDKDHLIKGLGEKILPYIEEIKVVTSTLEDIFNKYNINAIDLIHIDTEGFDYDVLCQINFAKYKPTIILYEHIHLNKNQAKSAINLLKNNEYATFSIKGDTLGILTKYLDANLLSLIQGLGL